MSRVVSAKCWYDQKLRTVIFLTGTLRYRHEEALHCLRFRFALVTSAVIEASIALEANQILEVFKDLLPCGQYLCTGCTVTQVAQIDGCIQRMIKTIKLFLFKNFPRRSSINDLIHTLRNILLLCICGLSSYQGRRCL
jgi:hypothetical protein